MSDIDLIWGWIEEWKASGEGLGSIPDSSPVEMERRIRAALERDAAELKHFRDESIRLSDRCNSLHHDRDEWRTQHENLLKTFVLEQGTLGKLIEQLRARLAGLGDAL